MILCLYVQRCSDFKGICIFISLAYAGSLTEIGAGCGVLGGRNGISSMAHDFVLFYCAGALLGVVPCL